MVCILLVPVEDVLILAGGALVFFELGRDLRRGGALGPEDCSSDDEDCIDEPDSVGRARSWKLVSVKFRVGCSMIPSYSVCLYYIRLMNDLSRQE